MRIDTIVEPHVSDDEAEAAKNVYLGSTEQADTYEEPTPEYARLVADLIGSMQPSSILELGCNAGRNLVLLSKRLPNASLTGVDVNPDAIRRGERLHNIPLVASDEAWLERQPTNSFDVTFTVSLIDHIPYPENVLRHLLRVTKHYLVLFELAHDRIGKTTHNLYLDGETVSLRPAYRYSYVHDYRYECERKFGAYCLLDAKVPIGRDNLLDLYRLYVFSRRGEWHEQSAIQSIAFKPISSL